MKLVWGLNEKEMRMENVRDEERRMRTRKDD